MEINFVTSNKNKVREFISILGPKVRLNHIEMSYPELRSDDPEEIARLSAKQLAEKLKKAVVVEDSGLFIPALNDFPGTSSGYFYKRAGVKGVLKLMEGMEDRRCLYKSAVAYCEPGKRPVSFLGTENGAIAEEIRGSSGFGNDPIFIPEGFRITYGEMENSERIKKFRKRAVEQLVKYIEQQK